MESVTRTMRPDFVIEDAGGKPLIVVEVKGRGRDPLSAVPQVEAYMSALAAPYGVVITPERGIVLNREGHSEFSSVDLLSAYGLTQTVALDRESYFAEIVYNWLIDLSFGIARQPAPRGLPDIVGDDVRRAA